MKLPGSIIISRRKLTDYLLSRRVEDDKSGYLALAGYTVSLADRLLEEIQALSEGDARFLEATEYGDKYEIRGRLMGPNGRMLHVVTIWMHEKAAQTKFITLYPDK
jgi:hypothetical protein